MFPSNVLKNGPIVCDCSYLFIYLFLLIQSSSIFYHNCLVHVVVLSGEITCMTIQHYNAFQSFIVTTMKIINLICVCYRG